MKKLLIALIVSLMVLAGCSNNQEKAAEKYSVGSYSVTSPISERNMVDGEKVQMNTTLATVILDGEGKIVNVNIDTAQTTVNINEEGELTLPAETPSKKERKDAYGMRDASPIGKEWYEQIESLEEYLVGKTLEEVKAIELADDNTVVDADLLSNVTVTVDYYLEATIKAMENAQEVDGEVAKVGSSVFTGFRESAAEEDKNGKVTFNTNYGHVVLDADGKILQAFVDVAQNAVEFNNKGEWQDFAPIPSKKVLKEDYNMKDVSPIGKEWYEQAAALEEYLIGKTVDEMNGIEKDEGGYPTQEDLVSDVTITINDYQQIITKAAQNAVDVK